MEVNTKLISSSAGRVIFVEDVNLWREDDRSPGDLVAVWNYETRKEDIGLVIKDDKEAEVNPFGRESYIRKIHVLIGGAITLLTKYDLFPVGHAQPEIPFQE